MGPGLFFIVPCMDTVWTKSFCSWCFGKSTPQLHCQETESRPAGMHGKLESIEIHTYLFIFSVRGNRPPNSFLRCSSSRNFDQRQRDRDRRCRCLLQDLFSLVCSLQCQRLRRQHIAFGFDHLENDAGNQKLVRMPFGQRSHCYRHVGSFG